MPLARWLAVVLALAAPAALGAQATPAAPSKPIGSAVALVDAYMAGWNAHDATKAASFMTDDVEYYDASTPAPQKGRANAQRNVIQAFLTAAPDCVWTRTGAPVVGNDGIAFQWSFKGTNTGPWGDGTKATGKPFTFNGVTLIRIRAGKIAYQGDYYDAYGFLKQLGLAQ
jgi:predicted ester cyclase